MTKTLDLTPEDVRFWTVQIVGAAPQALQTVSAGRPCDYRPWQDALKSLGGENADDRASALMTFAATVAWGKWPEKHGHLVEFALQFLEADVMLFRSGYAKRHMLRHLRQATLSKEQTARARRLIDIAILRGTGLEEFREVCRLGARIATPKQRAAWEDDGAQAYLTILDLYQGDERMLCAYDQATQTKIKKRSGFLGLPKYAFRADFSLPVIETKLLTKANGTARNAWHVTRHLQRVAASRLKNPQRNHSE